MNEFSKLIKCKVSLTDDNLRALQLDPNNKTEIERRIDQIQQLLKSAQAGGSNVSKIDAATIADINARNIKRVGDSVRTVAFNPDNVGRLQRFLVRDMAVVHHWLGLGDNFTTGGWVRESINRIRRTWSGGVSQALRDLGALNYAQTEYKRLTDMLKAKGLRQDQIDIITTESVEKGMYPILRGSENLAPRGLAVLDQKYAKFWDDLINVYGLSSKEADDVLKIGEGMGQMYHKVAVLAQDAGIDLKETGIWGYYPRILSDAAERRFNWKWLDENKFSWNDGKVSPVTESFLKSRTTSGYIVEDEVVFDYVVRQLGIQDSEDPLHYYKLATGGSIPDPGIADVLSSDFGLAQLLGAALEKGHPETVEALIDSGLLSKIPYSTTEVFEYIRNSLEFPFDNLREVFAVDWGTGMKVYREQLKTAASESGFVNLLVKQAIEENWGVSQQTRMMNMKDYGDWVPLRDVINPDILRQSFQSYNPMVGNSYVHPLVADLARSVQAIQMSPQAMGVYGRIMKQINTRFRQMALATIEYIPRQVWQNLISLTAAGGNVLMYPVNVNRFLMYQLFADNHPEFATKLFDNTRKRYRLADGQTLTELGLVRYLQDSGFLSRFEPLTGDAVNPAGYHTFNMKAQLRYLSHTFSTQGIARTAQEAAESFGGVVDKAMFPIAWSNNWLGNAAAFTTVESLTRIREAGIAEHVVHTGGRIPSLRFGTYGTVDEAVQHARQYFFYYDDRTWFDSQMSNYVIPFWGFTSKNIPAVARYAARHPGRFYAWQRAYALANSPMQDDEWMNEGSVDEWMLHSNPVFFKTPEGYFNMPMQSLDPFNSALGWLTAPGQALTDMFGIWGEHEVKTTRERLKDRPWAETGTNQLIAKLLEESFPVWKGLAAEVSGQTLTGVPLTEGSTTDEFLGMRMSPRMRMWLETLLPLLGTVNRYNPGNVFGTPPQYDVNAGKWSLGEPSIFGIPRSGRDRFQTNNPYQPLQYLGIKVYPVDVYLNAGLTYDSLSYDVREGKKYILAARSDLVRLPEGEERQRRIAEIDALELLMTQTASDLTKFRAFMQREGLDPWRAYNKLRASNIRIGDLPGGNEDGGQTEPEQ